MSGGRGRSSVNPYLYLLKTHKKDDERFTKWWNKYKALPMEERVEFDGMLQLLADKVTRLGLTGAFELVGALSDWMAKHPEVK